MKDILMRVALSLAIVSATFVGGCYFGEAREKNAVYQEKQKKVEKKQDLESGNQQETAQIDADGHSKVKESNEKMGNTLADYHSRIDGMQHNAGTSGMPQASKASGVVHGSGKQCVVRSTDHENIRSELKYLQSDTAELGQRGAQCAIKLTACQQKLIADQEMAARAD